MEHERAGRASRVSVRAEDSQKMTAVRINKLRPMVLTRTSVCGIMGLPNIGKEYAMQDHKTNEEVLEELFDELSELSAEEISAFFRYCEMNGVDFNRKPRE